MNVSSVKLIFWSPWQVTPNNFFRALSTTFFSHALIGKLLPLGLFQACLYILYPSQKQLHVITRLLNCSAVQINSCHDKGHHVDLKLIMNSIPMGRRRPLSRFMFKVAFLIWMGSTVVLSQNPLALIWTVVSSKLIQWLVFWTWTAILVLSVPIVWTIYAPTLHATALISVCYITCLTQQYLQFCMQLIKAYMAETSCNQLQLILLCICSPSVCLILTTYTMNLYGSIDNMNSIDKCMHRGMYVKDT